MNFICLPKWLYNDLTYQFKLTNKFSKCDNTVENIKILIHIFLLIVMIHAVKWENNKEFYV